jgi:protein TonB
MADTLLKDSWTAVIFEGKNKEYGAFELRHLYNKYTTRALLIGVVLFTLAISTPVIMTLLHVGENDDSEIVEVNLELLPPPPIDPNTPPPPPPPKIEMPKLAAAVKFLPPKVEEDKQISTENREGEKTEVDVIEEAPAAVVEEVKEEIFMVVEEMPEFEGGAAAMYKFIQKNMVYPRQASNMGTEGRVHVTFVVNANGEIVDPQVVKGIGSGCDEEALRVIKLMPKWKAGKQNGRAVKVKYTMPIKFVLN